MQRDVLADREAQIHGRVREPPLRLHLVELIITYYGITKPDGFLVATVNGFGVVVETVYITLFLIFAPKTKRKKATTATLVGILDVGFLLAAILVTQLALQGGARIDAIGFMCAGLNIIMYGSPLSAMVRIFRQSRKFLCTIFSFFEPFFVQN
ncbi:LOW QUALITY PROTEIN: hypothetical protein RJ639_002733 [Escallonia herrerae]|uniref:Uncharacterized protein n=1 Tax=Escallonia herrerae TaxID=1293975 RepID=A0AA88VYR7_9ASTE|nr:LOW QUALITY PROTEIN: hypothetical protein RJ639_002733 [Escallonia herrerae]